MNHLNTKILRNYLTIGIDLRQLVPNVSGGISQLTKGVLEELFSRNKKNKFIVFCTPFNRRVIDYNGANLTFHSIHPSNYIKEMDSLLTSESVDVLFRAYPMEDNLRFPMGKQIILIPDNQQDVYPEFFSPEAIKTRKVAFDQVLSSAGAVATISHFSINELKKRQGTKVTDFFLMQPALQFSHIKEPTLSDLTESEIALIPKDDFFIYPANLWKHKNHKNILSAFALFLKKSNRNVKFLFTGNPEGWSLLIADYPDLPIVHLGYVRPEFLRILLKRASAMPFFSLYEGFGIPLLEAFDADLPVICSNVTSLPEVAGDAAITCSPSDVESIAELMSLVFTDKKRMKELIGNGRKILKQFSWEKSAFNLMEACKRISAKPINNSIVNPSYNPLVTIVTPSYNQGQFLKRTIDSVLSQDYKNIEYIVIDGASTDNSVDVLKSYGDHFYWVSEKDNGQTDAINKGMRLAKGEILAYLNSDDILLPGAISKVVEFFSTHAECSMVYGNADYIDKYDKYLGPYRTDKYSFERLMQDCMICQPAAFWRKQVIEKIGFFDDSLNMVMDYDYWIRMAKGNLNIAFIEDKLACSRLYSETKTMSFRAEIYKEIFMICKKYNGYVHVNFYYGYWHHLIHEARIFGALVSRVRGIYKAFGWIHHKIENRSSYTKIHLINFIKRFLKWLIRKTAFRAFFNKIPASITPSFIAPVVEGLYNDCWISNNLIVPIKPVLINIYSTDFYIEGVPKCSGILSIHNNGKLIQNINYYSGTTLKVILPSSSITHGILRLYFSDYFIDNEDRKLVMKLISTNIFNEQDI